MANFAILRTGKLKSAASVKGMLKHNFRTIDTPNADENLTHSNEHLTAQSVDDGMRRYREQLPIKIRKNAVHAIDYMITTSPDAKTKDNARALDEAYSWLCEKHGKENIVMASKHFDETTPHAHFLVVPIDEKGKLNARHFIGGTKHRLSELQDEFHQRLKDKDIDLERGIKGSRAKHQKVKDWYAKREITSDKLLAKTNQVLAEKAGVFNKNQRIEKLETAYSKLADLTVNQIVSLKNEKEKYQLLEDTAKKQNKAVTFTQQLEKEIKRGNVKVLDVLRERAAENQTKIRAKNQAQTKTQEKNQDIER